MPNNLQSVPPPPAARSVRKLQRYLDESDAATYMGFSARALQEWRRRGSGPRFIRIGRRCVRYDVAELDAWMAARARNSTSDPGPRAA